MVFVGEIGIVLGVSAGTRIKERMSRRRERKGASSSQGLAISTRTQTITMTAASILIQ